jgi:predicted unusual protein kinase regulating ubiquinone biosynthesis (AarF/ABC1/UbiB family)
MLMTGQGLVTELTPTAERQFRSLLVDVATGNGTHCADMFLRLAQRPPAVPAAAAFRFEMQKLFTDRVDPAGGTHALLLHGPTLRALQNARNNPPLNVGLLINDIMALVRLHGLELESEFAMIVVSMSVLEGLARGLDPNIDLVGSMAPFFVSELRERASVALLRAAVPTA